MKNNRWTVKKFDVNEAIKQYNNGVYISQIAENMGITIDRVRRGLKMNGIITMSKSDFWKHYDLPFEDALIEDYVGNKMTIPQVIKKYAIGREKFNFILNKRNVIRRGRSEALMLDYKLGRRKPSRCNRTGTKNIFGQLFLQWRYGAKVRNMDYSLTKEDLQLLFEKQNGRCAYTNLELISPTTLKDRVKFQGHPKLISLDRISSELPYTINNVQFVCNWINKGKGNFTDELFKEVILEFKKEIQV